MIKKDVKITKLILHHAVKEFIIASKVLRIFLLQEILKHNDAKLLVDEFDLYENTPLHVAAEKGYALVTEVGLMQFFCIRVILVRLRETDATTPNNVGSC